MIFPSIIYLLTEHQTFCALFTSPSSSEAFDEQESEEGLSRKKQKSASQKKATKTNVATLLHMEGRVTPRAIAYAATLVGSFLSDLLQMDIMIMCSLSSTCMPLHNGLKIATTSASEAFTTSSSISSSLTVKAAINVLAIF
jgi:hypothetical protein